VFRSVGGTPNYGTRQEAKLELLLMPKVKTRDKLIIDSIVDV
jgi:hypothetical protein